MLGLAGAAVVGFGIGVLAGADAKIAVVGSIVFLVSVLLFAGQGRFETKLLGAVILVAATADIPRKETFGPITGLGLLTNLVLRRDDSILDRQSSRIPRCATAPL